ncbi:MAG TPA: hypothetical protein VFN49_00025 [Candidatus Aquilonibacter sp.]|nr:hypothetical protein [Candidatus Aquilonibacter sp.]
MKATNPTTQASRRYTLEFSAAIVLYMAVVFATRMAFRNASGPWEVVIALAPVVPVLLVFVAGLRLYAGTDEFNKRLMVESLAIAGVITALVAVTYGFMEGDIVPRPSAWWTWVLFMGSWLLSSFVLRLRYR